MTGWAALPSENILQLCFHGAEKPSEDINIHLFWMNEKGLMQCMQLHATLIFTMPQLRSSTPIILQFGNSESTFSNKQNRLFSQEQEKCVVNKCIKK
jgi:hypothetical protein